MSQALHKKTLTYGQLNELFVERLEARGVTASDKAPPILIPASDGIANWTAKLTWRSQRGPRGIAIASVLAELRLEFDVLK